MNVTIGDTLVYPHHGAVTVTDLRPRSVRGTDELYATMRVHTTELTIQLPLSKFEYVGVRNVIDGDEFNRVLAVLREPLVEEFSNWSRRFKANQEKMAGGDIYRISEVVRDLWRRDATGGVSAGEKRMLQKARIILESELALTLACTPERAAAVVDTTLSEEVAA
ncbi:MAG: CarD family transcriptional regulator [Microbacterium sp.]|uniref:CarD family transcriptional regulator n=1 Tax=Microbacterium sp. TaxID=51671 RepID=UPI001ACF7A1A|nr:CarD family transcriptional regulator [Microbacterium sp.]MBN9176993.1 CarD family transcriptional regulator [Microbacterium sp.]